MRGGVAASMKGKFVRVWREDDGSEKLVSRADAREILRFPGWRCDESIPDRPAGIMTRAGELELAFNNALRLFP